MAVSSDNADGGENRLYSPIHTRRMAQKKETLAEVSITINDIEIEKKEVYGRVQRTSETFERRRKAGTDHIKRGSEFVENEECAKIPLSRGKDGRFYNKLGELFYSRPIMPQEMQKTVFH